MIWRNDNHGRKRKIGEETDFILCIMIDQVTSEADIYPQIHELTETVYQALNES